MKRTRRIALAILGVAVVVVVLAAIASAFDRPDGRDSAASVTPTDRPNPSWNPEESAAAASAMANAGIPPEPNPQVWAAYIADLTAIDPDIVHGKEEKAIDRGRNQCSSVKSSPDDQAKLVDLTNQRFSSPKHPNGFGLDKAAKILAAVRKHLCP